MRIAPSSVITAIGYDDDRVLRAKNARTASSWITGPGAVELLIEGYKLLLGASAAAGKRSSKKTSPVMAGEVFLSFATTYSER